MKKIYFLLFSICSFVGQAQTPDITVTNCNGVSNSIYSELANAKVLLVASEGFDCGNCQSEAAGLQAWAAQNKSQISVWGAMTYTYSASIPPCSDLYSWVSTYGWNDIYTFIDSSESWFMSGTPRFTVYSPADSSIAYQGFDEGAAKATAIQLAGSTVGLAKTSAADFFISQANGELRLHNLAKGKTRVQLTSMTGKVVMDKILYPNGPELKLEVGGMKPGIYLVSVQNNAGLKTVRKIYLN